MIFQVGEMISISSQTHVSIRLDSHDKMRNTDVNYCLLQVSCPCFQLTVSCPPHVHCVKCIKTWPVLGMKLLMSVKGHPKREWEVIIINNLAISSMYGKDSSPVITRTIIKANSFLKGNLMRKHSWCFWVKFALEIIQWGQWGSSSSGKRKDILAN